MADEAIRFQAQVFKLQTLIDGGWRLTLDLLPIDGKTITELSNAKQPGIILDCAAVATDNSKNDRKNSSKPRY